MNFGKKELKQMNEGWKELRNAILLRAVDDYQMLVDKQITPKYNCNFGEIEEFLASEWCNILTAGLEYDGKDVLKVLQEYRRTHEHVEEY